MPTIGFLELLQVSTTLYFEYYGFFDVSENKFVIIDQYNIDDYIAVMGYEALYKALTKMKPEEVIATVKDSGLQGRGGAGFSTGLKWELTAKNESDQKYVVCQLTILNYLNTNH